MNKFTKPKLQATVADPLEAQRHFLGGRTCDRCHEPARCTIMSRFNTDTLCIPCETRERAHPKYQAAHDAELAAVRAGNMNFPGIGCPPELYAPERSASAPAEQIADPASVAGDEESAIHAYRDAASEQYEDDDIRIDNDAVVSISEDGAFVAAWVWVARDSTDLCSTCNARTGSAGDGYDGLCAACADAKVATETVA